MLALSGIATASASAAECPGTGEGIELCSGGHVMEGTFAFTGKEVVGPEKRFELVGIMSLTCHSATSKGELVASKGKLEIIHDSGEWVGCQLVNHASCKVKPITFGPGAGLKGAIASAGEIDELKLSPAEGERKPFAEFGVTGCEQELSGKVTGTQTCKLPHSIRSEAAKHELECNSGELALKYGNRQVVVAIRETIELSSGKAFSLQQG